MQRPIEELLKAKAMLLLKREQELYLLGVVRARTAGWLRAFNGLTLELDAGSDDELAERWGRALVAELQFQTAAVFWRVARTSRFALVAGRSRAAVPPMIALPAADELARETHGLRDRSASASVEALAVQTGLGKFLWAHYGDYIAVAGFVPETAPFVTISSDDPAYFDMLARHLIALLRNRALVVELTSSLAAVRTTQVQLAGKVTELEATREQLVQSEKLAVAGQLAGAVAHEVNNPLVLVLGGLDVVSEYASSVETMWRAAKAASWYLSQRSEPEAREHALRLLVETSEQDTDELMRTITDSVRSMIGGVHRLAALVKGFRQLATGRRCVPERVAIAAIAGALGVSCTDREMIAMVDHEALRSLLGGRSHFWQHAVRATRSSCTPPTAPAACT